MNSRISLNVHGENIPDISTLEDVIEKLRPEALLVLDNLGLAKQQAAKYPDMITIYRQWKATAGKTNGDDDLWKKVSPAEFVAERLAQFDGAPLWAYTTNEPEFSEGSIRWHVEVMERAANVGLRLVVGNWGVGIPTDVDHDWQRAHRMLELLAEHRDTMIFGLHEYACGVVTSGFIGGTPEERKLIYPESWPEDVAQIGALWHCGRFRFAVKYCASVGIRPPRIIITEHGFDDVSDIKPWTEKLLKTPTFGNPGGNIRGWKTLVNQWAAWFGRRGWSAERAYFEQVKYADQKIYQGSAVEAQLIYCWGHSSDTWAQFDIAEARELHGLLAGYAETPPPDPLPANGEGEMPSDHVAGEENPPPESTPEDEPEPSLFPTDWPAWQGATLTPVNDAVNVRLNPGTEHPVLNTVRSPGIEVVYAVGFAGDWIPVIYYGVLNEWKGWVHRDYATLSPLTDTLAGEVARLRIEVATLRTQVQKLENVIGAIGDTISKQITLRED